ncbi:MAG: GNAT family N-acetyltransferase [Bacillota bacterium]
MSHTVPLVQLEPQFKLSHLKVRKALPEDLEGVVRVAASVGNNQKDPETGFLMGNYAVNKQAFLQHLKHRFKWIDYFYVAEAMGEVIGFLQAFSRERWLEENPFWLSEVYWKPGFGHLSKCDFVLIEKTAVLAPMTGMGIGSKLYEALFADMRARGVCDVMAETVVSPVPNLASLRFRIKQNYMLVGIRYERWGNETITDLVYHKKI